jgi:hypothetical protein
MRCGIDQFKIPWDNTKGRSQDEFMSTPADGIDVPVMTLGERVGFSSRTWKQDGNIGKRRDIPVNKPVSESFHFRAVNTVP